LLAYCWTLKMETYSSKTSLDFQRAIWLYIPEDRILPNVVLSRVVKPLRTVNFLPLPRTNANSKHALPLCCSVSPSSSVF
jgi:hypothetical protein